MQSPTIIEVSAVLPEGMHFHTPRLMDMRSLLNDEINDQPRTTSELITLFTEVIGQYKAPVLTEDTLYPIIERKPLILALTEQLTGKDKLTKELIDDVHQALTEIEPAKLSYSFASRLSLRTSHKKKDKSVLWTKTRDDRIYFVIPDLPDFKARSVFRMDYLKARAMTLAFRRMILKGSSVSPTFTYSKQWTDDMSPVAKVKIRLVREGLGVVLEWHDLSTDRVDHFVFGDQFDDSDAIDYLALAWVAEIDRHLTKVLKPTTFK